MTANIHVGLVGRYTLTLRNAAGDITREMEFDNLITDAGLEHWGTSSNTIDRCSVGSGNTAPTVSDTTLAAPITTVLNSTSGVFSNPTGTYDAAARWQEVAGLWRFGPGVGTGDIREVGVGWNGGLWSRALVRDGNGNPTTISKLSDETLDVKYTLRIQYPANDVSGTVTISGTTYNWTARAAELTSLPYLDSMFQAPAASDGSPMASALTLTSDYNNDTRFRAGSGGLEVTTSSCTTLLPGNSMSSNRYVDDYVPNSKARTVWIVANLDYCNGSIGVLFVRINCNWVRKIAAFQVAFTPPIVKNNTQRLIVGFTFSWGRG